jgi:hypothetical protein
MNDLANALRGHDTTDLSDEALQPIRFITSRLEGFSLFFNALDEEDRNYLFGKYGVELQQTAELVVSYALTVQQSRGDETIAEELARLPAFATTNTSTTASTTTEPTNGSVQVLDGDMSTLLTVNDVAGLAGGVGLSTKQIDMRAMAENVDPTQVEHMISFDSLSFVAADRTQGLTLTTIKFDSEEEADSHMALLALEASTMQDFADTIGDESGSL